MTHDKVDKTSNLISPTGGMLFGKNGYEQNIYNIPVKEYYMVKI